MASDKIHKICSSVDERVQSLIKPDRFYIGLYDAKRHTIEFPWMTENSTHAAIREVRQVVENQLPDHVLVINSPVHFEKDFGVQIQISKLTYWPGGDVPASWLGVPIAFEGKTLGFMIAESYTSGAFDQRAASLLSTIASQTATAIERVRLDEVLERRIRGLDAVNTFGQRLSSTIQLSEAEILKLIHEQASEIMDTNNMYIAMYDEETDMVRFGLMYVDGEATHVESRRGGKGRTEWIIRNRRPILDLTRTESEAWYKVENRQEYIGEPFASWIGVPLVVNNQVIGVIATYHKTSDFVYDEHDLLILTSMANHAAMAIDNSRLLVQAMQRTLQLEQAQQTIAETEALLVRTGFAADYVHRMNNSAGTIPVWVDLIRDYFQKSSIQSEELNEYLSNIENEANNLLREAEKLKLPPQKSEVDLENLVYSLVRQAHVQMPASVTINLKSLASSAKVYANRSDVANAFWNIIQNGLEAMDYNGQLDIEIKRVNENQWLEISISDCGPGIPGSQIDDIFEPFVTTKARHTGYGLWRSKSIFNSLGGTIDCKNNEGLGATFTIRLPLNLGGD